MRDGPMAGELNVWGPERKPPEMELELDPTAWKAINSRLLLKAIAKVAGHGTDFVSILEQISMW